MERGASRAAFPRGAWERSNERSMEPARSWSAERPTSLASQAPTGSELPRLCSSPLKRMSVSSTELLILIHPPLWPAEWRCASGDWRAAPGSEAALIDEVDAPGWTPERRNPSLRGPNAGASLFLLTFLRRPPCQPICHLCCLTQSLKGAKVFGNAEAL
jgi:hypothetical protein